MEGECDRDSVSEEVVDVSRRASNSDVEHYLESHPQVVQRWLLERAEPDFLQRLLLCRGYRGVANAAQEGSQTSSTASLQHDEGHGASGNAGGIIPRSKRNSVTSELFQIWLAASPIKRAKSPSR
jgi:hypothetical protein